MKKIILITLIFAALTSFGKCDKKKNYDKKKVTAEKSAAKLNATEVWMRYDETNCENPWNFNWFVKPTEEQILGAVEGDLLGREINILEIKSVVEKDFISCEVCTCPNGRHFFVRTLKSDIGKLKEMKFYEVKELPDFKEINENNNTK